MLTSEIENYPGYPHGIEGPELMAHFRVQAERFGTVVHVVDIARVDFCPGRSRCGSAAPATPATAHHRHRRTAQYLNLDSEQRLRGRGVSACATCDGAFFRGREIVGRGRRRLRVEEALFLTRFASKVTCSIGAMLAGVARS